MSFSLLLKQKYITIKMRIGMVPWISMDIIFENE